MKHFIVSDDKKRIAKMLKGIETIDQKDKKLTLCKVKFNECLQEANRKRNQKTFGKSSRLFSFNSKLWKKQTINKLCKCLDA